METIVEPMGHIERLWGKQRIIETETYRLMRYVLRVDHDGNVLLHNVVTGQLVVLEPEEAHQIEQLPGLYNQTMLSLVTQHFLVPLDYDEHQQVNKLRMILRKIDDATHKDITQYKILPTTACNAQCYYCFEHGIATKTMSEEIANDVIRYIEKHHGKKEINITWFGGEPTVASARIDQISKGLRDSGIPYRSDMISNGYLFDENMVDRAKNLWKLKAIQISVDGTETNYNRVKDYRNAKDNPYVRVIRNVGLLLEAGISVGLRMNFDLGNFLDFQDLLKEMDALYHGNPRLQVYAYPVIGEYPDHDGNVLHGSDAWLAEKVVELNDYARNAGLYRRSRDLPFLCFIGCEADRMDSVVINPSGMIGRCGEHVEDEMAVGSVTEGVTNHRLFDSWRTLGDYDSCAECVFYPKCVKILNCAAKDQCYFQDRNQGFEVSVRRRFDAWKARK